ncbi:hypothetical protein LTR36_004890 [Oleoguttula mirabilis]|uniref:Uncharacterized protein n=1 Tax=Oleoguttula mirabilis TaxID=1507867 RepID=A0AAV9JGC9_9PEZI|nr:hypothetical protein LTR36_004890 [Oleoguttula mirabilis]
MDSPTTGSPAVDRLQALPQELRDRINDFLLPLELNIRLWSVPITQNKRAVIVIIQTVDETHKNFTALLETCKQCRADALSGFSRRTTLRCDFSALPTTIDKVRGEGRRHELPNTLLHQVRSLTMVAGYTLQPRFYPGSVLFPGAFSRLRSTTSVTLRPSTGIIFNNIVEELKSNYSITPTTQTSKGFPIERRLQERMHRAAESLCTIEKFTLRVLERMHQVFVYKRATIEWTDAQGRLRRMALLSQEQGHYLIWVWYLASGEPDAGRRLALVKRVERSDDDRILAQLSTT